MVDPRWKRGWAPILGLGVWLLGSVFAPVTMPTAHGADRRGASPPWEEGTFQVVYDVYAAGVPFGKVEFEYQRTGNTYRMYGKMFSGRLVRWVVNFDVLVYTEGTMENDRMMPLWSSMRRVLKSGTERTVLRYADNGKISRYQFIADQPPSWSQKPPDDELVALGRDINSLYLELLLDMRMPGWSCQNAELRYFMAGSRTDMLGRDPVNVEMVPSHRNIFRGEAEKCHVLFLSHHREDKGEDLKRQERDPIADIWLSKVGSAKEPMPRWSLPVKFRIKSRYGYVVMVLSEVGAADGSLEEAWREGGGIPTLTSEAVGTWTTLPMEG